MNQIGDLLKAVILVTIMASIFFASMFFVVYLVPFIVVGFVTYVIYLIIRANKDEDY